MIFVAGAADAAGPDAVARSNRSLWPDAIGSPAGFDRASRAELLAFAHQLASTEGLNDEAWRARLHLKEIETAHLNKIRGSLWQRLAQNYTAASARCSSGEPFCPVAKDVDSFKRASNAFGAPGDERYRPWYENAAIFHRIYLDEMLRLAALFPRISSEDDTFDDTVEFTGSEFPDLQFFLTFDDGPSAAGGNTEKLLAVLRQARLNATFFVLGNNLEARKNDSRGSTIDHLYTDMCVGMHGWEHKSHSNWTQWQDSVIRTTELVHNQLAAEFTPLFRPPYGQRKADSGAFFSDHHLQVALWNIDSQDWNGMVSGDEAGQRVLTLMLLWRHGVILFHDIHSKAQIAVPYLLAQTHGSSVKWAECRELQRSSFP